jgi:hypothetical protein
VNKLVFVLLLAACGATPKQTDILIESSTAYQEGVRWGRFEDAALYLRPEQRDAFLDERDALGEDLRIDDYEVIRVHMASGQKSARVRVKYTWHLDSVGKVHESVTEQSWTRDGTRWQLDREVMKRGEPLPGVLETSPDEAGSDVGDAGAGDDGKASDPVGR